MLELELMPRVTVRQLKAIEINPYAYELAQVSVQIGYLQWRRDNGFDNDRTPVLQVLDGFENKDALLHETFRKKPKNLKKAREEEHQSQDETAIGAAAKELNELRERWLNPPEWTVEKVLEFPGTKGGPWDRYIHPTDVDARTGIGAVRYPRLEPKNADCAARLKKRTLMNLYNERPAWLDVAHKKLDAAAAAAYGWVQAGQANADLSDEQILEKLLALNLERAAEEQGAAAKSSRKAKVQRARTGGTK